MARTRFLNVAAVMAAALLPAIANAQKTGGIKPGGTFQGEIPASAKQYNQRTYGYPTLIGQGVSLRDTLVPIRLKAGQSLSVWAEVTGSGRKVSLCSSILRAARRLVEFDRGQEQRAPGRSEHNRDVQDCRLFRPDRAVQAEDLRRVPGGRRCRRRPGAA